MTRIYAIEGLDRLGKSTLIEGILNRKGFHQVIPFGKPRLLEAYVNIKRSVDAPPEVLEMSDRSFALYMYQRHAFIESMIMTQSKPRIIFDRWHLGEAVYAPLYRDYSGDYVFELEKKFLMFDATIRLILLTEDFETSKHFVSDGDSFDDSKRQEEQQLFLEAFRRSNILDKRKICVTDKSTGQFRPAKDILEEALK